MKKLFYISLLFSLLTEGIKAQAQIDSIYISKVDSIINVRQGNSYKMPGKLVYKQVDDSLKMTTIAGIFENGQLISLYYTDFGCDFGCEDVTFHLHNDSLIYIKYFLSDPDIRSRPPPSTTYILYYKNEKQIYYSTSFYGSGARSCKEYSLDKKSFLEEFYYYKDILIDK